MFSEDYLVRLISQALAALMTAIGLKKAGKYTEARQAVDQAIEQLTTLPANLIEQMDDASILSILTTQGQLDIERLALLGDLFQEQGEILSQLNQPAQALSAYERALRFILEVALADDRGPSLENIGKIETLFSKLKERILPSDTQLALSDYYLGLLDKPDQILADAGLSRTQVGDALAKLQDHFDHL